MLFYDSDNDESDVDENDVVESTAASQMSSASITSCSLGAAIVAEARNCAAPQSYDHSCKEPVTESRQPANVSSTSAAAQDSPTALTKQQVCNQNYHESCLVLSRENPMIYYYRLLRHTGSTQQQLYTNIQ